LIDFHTHSAASDGALSAPALLARAITESLQCLALTDHDTVAGYQCVKNMDHSGLKLISGVELSCQWGRTGIHVVGLNLDVSSSVIQSHLSQLDLARSDRAERIAHKLDREGISDSLAGALAVANGAQIGRPHFARWMVLAGHVESEAVAFKRFLGRGKPGDISLLWPSLADTVSAITNAGGVAVLAHPLHYKMTMTRLRALCRAFHEAGGTAIEVINGRPRLEEVKQLWRLVEENDLLVSVGSDFHRDSPYGAGLGVDPASIPRGYGVWETWC
jgi:3',5'-nucleoside bisphosphate phosphatase